jgi:hypothetical protein
VPGSISYTIAMMLGFYRWLEPESGPSKRAAALTT